MRHPKLCCLRSHQNNLCNTIADQEKVQRHTYIATFFHHSLNAAEKLREIQMQIGTEEKLIQDIETHDRTHHSTYLKDGGAILSSHYCTFPFISKHVACVSATELQQLKNAVTTAL